MSDFQGVAVALRGNRDNYLMTMSPFGMKGFDLSSIPRATEEEWGQALAYINRRGDNDILEYIGEPPC